jgi:hypothetical protein
VQLNRKVTVLKASVHSIWLNYVNKTKRKATIPQCLIRFFVFFFPCCSPFSLLSSPSVNLS